jgi:L-alanine-DL-glutamate epimerase-like enolase superfamily enzyme
LGDDVGRWVLVRVEASSGHVGWGEATPLADWGGDYGRYYGETPATVRHVVEDRLAPAILGLDIWEQGALEQRFATAIRGHPYARAALEMAVWDLRGRLSGQPIHRLLGGAVRSEIPVAHMLGLMTPGEAVQEVQAALGDGVRAFQIKLTGVVSDDVEKVAAVRNAAGPEPLLRGDVNQGYRGLPVKQAIAAVRALQGAGIDLVEQPMEGLTAMAAVRDAVKVEIMADESCWTVQDALEVIEAGAADAISIYVAKAGGIGQAQAIAAIAHASAVPCDVNGSLESGIGTLASVQLAAACQAISLPSVISAPAPNGVDCTRRAGRYYEDDVLVQAPPFEAGHLHVPCGPGLGIEIDEEKVRFLTNESRGG